MTQHVSLVRPLEEYCVDPVRVDKPWGFEVVWALGEQYCGKVLFVEAGETLSLQYHERKDETIHVHSGLVEISIGRDAADLGVETVGPGRGFRIRPGIVHRMRAVEDTLMLEVSTPELEDVVRLEDRYGRD